ncbi:tetraacyldisaccharide 4'-kinase [Leptospirillum ferriphilum]|uniref:Tetraacyldisaccharide 4'-kinase n=2 Tax=Leptospirillum TaxID=179 RepID=A0A094YJT7_9BACT|nr:tetraacyldisaccharide 4'-kinase [Leptospirillum ferriphilum]EDZ38974.1 MAG: Tetraacyldisaccharide-1-P 4'-kinase [Leptospirillum sp. Group II '5-way CG']KGA93466.1 Tetraacyldisaccharide 4'-kinase [Leptospirillum ferriphilum]
MISRPWLAPFTLAYAGGLFVWEECYRRGVFSRKKLSIPVIGIGGITVGGAGKTPATICILRTLIRKGLSPGVLTRGYGRKKERTEPFLFRSVDNLSPEIIGDEPAMMADRFPETLFCISSDRAIGGIFLETAGVDVVLLDDGFQSLELHQDLRVVILPPEVPSGGADSLFQLLPSGNLRDFPMRLKEADVLLNIRESWKRKDKQDFSAEKWEPYRGQETVLLSATIKPSGIREGQEEIPLHQPSQESAVVLVSGIARPQRFFQMLESLGFRILGHLVLPDHVRYTTDVLRKMEQWVRMIEKKEGRPIDKILVTEKDWAKLSRQEDLDPRVRPIGIRMEWDEEHQWAEVLFRKFGWKE